MSKMKKIIVLMITSVLAMSLFGCGKTSIIGTWSETSGTGETETEISYTFEEGGKGTYNEGEIGLTMSYKTEEDKLTLSIVYLGQTKETTYTYKIKGSTLTLTPSEGEEITLTKKK